MNQDDLDQKKWADEQPFNPVVSAEKAIDICISKGVRAFIPYVADQDYSITTSNWITTEGAKSWISVISGLSLKYSDESEDCDDFARFCAAWMQKLHNDTRPGNTALAFFEFHYENAEFGPHAIVGAIQHRGGEEYDLMFFEPQPTKMVADFPTEVLKQLYPTTNEINSCYFLRF